MSVLVINTNYLTGTLWVYKISTGVCFIAKFNGEKNENNQKTSGHGTAGTSKSGLGNNQPMLNVYDVVPRVRKINRYNQHK